MGIEVSVRVPVQGRQAAANRPANDIEQAGRHHARNPGVCWPASRAGLA
ncbi:hypothetical protein C4K38_3227 [Pseudomonas chlororaphis subsp. piscium]|nr:hypothetical protein C4K38_3227 [Pseudomonas chlororaphis subsp. piscium]